MKRRLLVIGMALVMVSAAGEALADPIGPECGSCYGNVFTLKYETVGVDLYRVTLVIDSSGFVPIGSPEWLHSVAFKVAANDADYLSVVPVARPIGWTSHLALGAGFLTDTNVGSNQFDLPDGTIAWTWDVGIAPGRLFAGPDEASVKATYFRAGPAGGVLQRLTSEPISLQVPVPEPASFFLFSTGLVGLRALKRRRG